MVRLLRASGGDATELAPQPTPADLPRLMASSGIEAELTDGHVLPTVGTPAQRALYRAVQEALANVRKHAPGATATVELCQDGAVVVTVTNTPPSRPALALPSARQGLIGLKERADILHGTIESGPTKYGGYRMRMRIPAHPD
ncbi:hypothetical protein [Amycolatopsis sp.]|jgi:signal transduction histidine kinase|uniref:sensor histidine kinase n=1 Tax=Amycolatopsis sp. TaxID=37632 RepID=UPI002DF95311|nr:hypothetical protein [Amycolatopsis sp.]